MEKVNYKLHIKTGVWYNDRLLNRFKVLSVQEHTLVMVEEEDGERRLVNRFLFEKNLSRGEIIEEATKWPRLQRKHLP